MSIVIPVRDAAGLPPMLRSLPAADEVIVVTAAPVPDKAVLAACPGALLVRQTRAGLGNALACGVAVSTGDIVVTLDGDGATDPGEMRRYVDALVAGADVAAGSRYREGGRDLTAGRVRRAVNRVLVWLLNLLYGVRRTDPGFGYSAFWRQALNRLALPDPSATLPVWGDGPEIEALLTVRCAARGLLVTEVPGVAYPRMRRNSRADRTTVRHWLRALLTEYRGRTPHPPRHSATVSSTATPSPERGLLSTRRVPFPERLAMAGDGDELSTGAPHDLHFSARIEIGGGPRRASISDDQDAGPERVNPIEPIWGPPRRSNEPAHLWLADIPAPLDRPARPMSPAPGPPMHVSAPGRPGSGSAPMPGSAPRQPVIASVPGQPVIRSVPGRPVIGSVPDQPVIASVPAPRTAGGPVPGRRRDDRLAATGSDIGAEEAAEPRREVGTERRHLEGYRQRPDLRLIAGEGAGEGTGSGRSRSGRLRAVPPREITGGRPGPQK